MLRGTRSPGGDPGAHGNADAAPVTFAVTWTADRSRAEAADHALTQMIQAASAFPGHRGVDVFRLDGPQLARTAERDGAELPSEGVIRGSVQVPPSGRPTVFLADHPVTGGYPVIGVVLDAATDRAGQVRPGTTVRFRRSGLPSGKTRS